MMPWWMLVILIFGVNFLLWGSVGLCRLLEAGLGRLRCRGAARRRAGRRRDPAGGQPPGPRAAPPARPGGLAATDVAVLIPAHNEAEVIGDSLAAIMALVPPWNIHVVSDASTDGTAGIAAAAGVKVIQTRQNLGKAGALREAIASFRLTDRFPVVMLLDADTRVEPGYFDAALPLFDNPEVVAVAGCVRTAADRELSFAGSLLADHRRRIYALGQRVLKFGQTWLRLNATHIVPGFASLYRADVLPDIDMNPPGLVIEDFNMTFEVYQKRLGKVAFTLGAVAVTQDPDNFRDYIRQTRRWALGLWQTVRRHRPRPNLFTVMLGLLLAELITSSLIFLVLPPLMLILLAPQVWSAAVTWPGFGLVYAVLSAHVSLYTILYGVALPDLAMTVAVAILERRPAMLLFAAFFLPLRVVDAAIGLYAIPLMFWSKSTGRWRSPARRAGPAPPPAAVGLPPELAAAQPVPAAGPATANPVAAGPVAENPAGAIGATAPWPAVIDRPDPGWERDASEPEPPARGSTAADADR